MTDQFGIVTKEERLANLAKATTDLVAQTPSKIYDEIANDLSTPEGRVRLGLTAGTSTAIGFGGTALLAKAPKVGAVILGGAALYQGYRYVSNALDFMSEAGDANDEYSQRLLVERASHGLARESATMIESTPGLIVGGVVASKTVGVPKLYQDIAGVASNKVGTPIKQAYRTSRVGEFVNEQWAFRGPGGMRLSSTVIKENGQVNVLEISEMIGRRATSLESGAGVETARSIDLIKLKVSRPAVGKEGTVDLGFKDKFGRLTEHTHPLETPIGTRPGRYDVTATRDLGMIRRGDQTAFFVGQAREYQAAAAIGKADVFAPKVQSLVLDNQRQSAFLLDAVWQPQSSSWANTAPKFVDYHQARKTLSSLDISNPWAQFQQLTPVTNLRGRNVDYGAFTWFDAVKVPGT